jgi:hypothetical protein
LKNAKDENNPETSDQLVERVNYLAGEVKLLAINLAITLARMKGREKILGGLESRFTELIKRANDTAQQVTDVLNDFRNKRRINSGLPASTAIIEQRGAYDCIEAKLNYIHKLSREVLETITTIKQQEQMG